MRELDGTARKKRRRWRVWTGSLGLVIAGWSLFLTCKYVYGCTREYTGSGLLLKSLFA